MFACLRNRYSFVRNPKMLGKSRNGLFCLSIIVGFFLAASLNDRPPSLLSIRPFQALAKQKDSEHSTLRSDILKSDQSTSYPIAAPKFAKGITSSPPILNPDSSASIRPVFEKNRRQAVLELIHYPWEDLGFNVVFMGSRSGYRAMTLTARHRIEIYVRPRDGALNQAYDLAHELGHAFDLKNNNEDRRRKWLALRGIDPSTPWFGCDACPDYGTPAGDFAETFAFLLLGPGNFHSMMAPLPTANQILELAAFCQIEHLSESLSVLIPKEGKAAKITEEVKPPATQDPRSIDSSEGDRPVALTR